MAGLARQGAVRCVTSRRATAGKAGGPYRAALSYCAALRQFLSKSGMQVQKDVSKRFGGFDEVLVGTLFEQGVN